MDIKERVRETLKSMRCVLEAHDGFAELGEIRGNRVEIHCGGRCAVCDEKCIEEAVIERVPGIEIIFK